MMPVQSFQDILSTEDLIESRLERNLWTSTGVGNRFSTATLESKFEAGYKYEKAKEFWCSSKGPTSEVFMSIINTELADQEAYLWAEYKLWAKPLSVPLEGMHLLYARPLKRSLPSGWRSYNGPILQQPNRTYTNRIVLEPEVS
jgi:hypothetical protein